MFGNIAVENMVLKKLQKIRIINKKSGSKKINSVGKFELGPI